MAGRATLTAVASRNTIVEPRIVAMIVRRLRRRSSDKACPVYGGGLLGPGEERLRPHSQRGRLTRRMRGRVAFITLASLALVAVPAGAQQTKVELPIGCTHGGAPFHTHGPRGKKRIAIGFDDGPSDYTLRVLRVLRQFDSHATFFEIGQETSGRAQTMKKILAQGSEIGNH